MVEAVLLAHGLRHLRPPATHVRQQHEIVLATVDKNVTLNLAIPFLCIVVQTAELFLRLVVEADVALQLTLTLGQHLSDALCQGQTRVASLTAVFRRHHHRHGLQSGDEAVVACQVDLVALQILGEGQLVTVELIILLRGLMTGVGQVEHVALLLRIEHQRVLVGLLHRQQQLGDQLLRACPPQG